MTTTFKLHHPPFPTPLLSHSSPLPLPRSKTLTLTLSLTRKPLLLPSPLRFSLYRYAFDETPAGDKDDENPFFKQFRNTESEEVARRRNWVERSWAPWEEILSPEADFAKKSLDEGVEVPLKSPEAIEAFKMLTLSYRKKKIEEIGEDEYFRRLCAIKGEIPEPLKTFWAAPLALQLVPPRDWPPKGWDVDKDELEFIREAHKLQSMRVDIEGTDETGETETDGTVWEEPDDVWSKRFEELLQKEGEEKKETGDSVLGKYDELWSEFKSWAETNRDRLEMEGKGMDMEREFWKQYKEWVESKRDGLEGEEQGTGVGKMVERYEKFLKYFKEKAFRESEKREGEARERMKGMNLERYNVFLKQYMEWVEANRDKLEEESYKHDQDYYPGRRKRGKDYKEDMLELPFVYPGQMYQGNVISLSLYQGAFIDIGCVHDGWVPIKGNDWYWIRHHIKVGMHVTVEVLEKRDPYRFRFPIELRFVYPNIDHLIFNKFECPPIFHREEDTNLEDLWRESEREPIPRKRPENQVKIEDQPLISDHPYVDELWHLHNAEQMILDHEEENPEKYKDKKYEDTVDLSFDEENSVEYTKAYYQKALIPKTILNTNIKDLDLDAARAERKLNNRLKKEAEERGEEFKIPKLRRNIEMDEYDLMHWQRSLEEREALIRDISCRKAFGLPLEEPGRYIDDKKFWGKEYDPTNPVNRHDYWGELGRSAKEKQENIVRNHNRSILGMTSRKWYELSYDEVVRRENERQEKVEKLKKALLEKKVESEREERIEEEEEDYDDDIDFDYSVLGSSEAVEVATSKPVINGTEPLSSMSD